MDEQTKYERFFVRSSMVLEKRGTISEEENRLSFFFFLYEGSMEHLNEKLRYNRLLKNRNADLTAFLFFLDFKAPKLSGTIERKVAVSL
ncbi:hypothetical protein MX633_12950 [Carnobacterium divergens]|nr:hypothetical protein [Carnobacterium divergens]